MRIDRPGRAQVHRAEPPRIIEGHTRATLHVEDHMVMFRGRRVVMVEGAEHRPRHEHPPGHAQMDDQRLAARQVREDVF